MQFASIRVLFFSLTVVVLLNRLHRVYAVWFQILLFSTGVRFSTKTLAYLAYKAYKALMAFQGIHGFHGFQAFATQFVPKIPLNNIFQCGLAAINTTCICVCKYFARLRHNAPGDRNPNTLKYKTIDQRVL